MNKQTVLLCWIGKHDLHASMGASTPGPICQAALFEKYSSIHLLYNYDKVDCIGYRDWLQGQIDIPIQLHPAQLEHPMHFEGIYANAQRVMDELIDSDPKVKITLHLSPGTSAMATAWIILGKVHIEQRTGRHARLIHSSIEAGVQETVISLDLAVFKPAVKAFYDQPLPKDFIVKDPGMLRQLEKLKKIAPWDDINILILGSTGTGKERFAEMAYDWNRKHHNKTKKPFVAINCAAIPDTLVESELFGTERGKITDVSRHDGKFQEADGGTLFMDEIGELSISAQAKVLRAIQERKLTRVGGSKIENVNVRIIAATNQDLVKQVSKGRFREDLYYRLAQATIIIPPLQQRTEDIPLIAKSFLVAMNKRGCKFAGYQNKELSQNALDLLKAYHWPGNIRELQIVINQAAIWTEGKVITASDIRQYMSQLIVNESDSHPLLPELGPGMNLESIVKNIKKYYAETAYNRTQNQEAAAHMLGYKGRSSIKHLLT